MISQFIVLSLRGDTIVSRDYRYDVPPGSAETFFRTLKFGVQGGGEEAPPVFHVDSVNYFHLKVRRSRCHRAAACFPKPWNRPLQRPAAQVLTCRRADPTGRAAAGRAAGNGVAAGVHGRGRIIRSTGFPLQCGAGTHNAQASVRRQL